MYLVVIRKVELIRSLFTDCTSRGLFILENFSCMFEVLENNFNRLCERLFVPVVLYCNVS